MSEQGGGAVRESQADTTLVMEPDTLPIPRSCDQDLSRNQ